MPLIQCNGLEVHYIAPLGLPTSNSHQVVLLVHGAGGSSRHWEPLLKTWLAMPLSEPALPNRVIPIALDLPGHGATSGTVLKSVAAIADFLNTFLDTVAIANPVCYVGHSAGGLLGLQFALSYPERVDRLVLIASSACIQLHPDFLQQAITGEWDYTVLHQSFGADVPADVQQLVLNEFQHLRLSPDAGDFMDLNAIDLRPALPTLQIPALIITGDDDVIISPRKSKLLQRELAHAELVTIPGGGHYVQVEQPAMVATALSRFLQPSQLPAYSVS